MGEVYDQGQLRYFLWRALVSVGVDWPMWMLVMMSVFVMGKWAQGLAGDTYHNIFLFTKGIVAHLSWGYVVWGLTGGLVVVGFCPLYYVVGLATDLLIALGVLLERLDHLPSRLKLVIMRIGLIPIGKVIIALPHAIMIIVFSIKQLPGRSIIPI